jgi:hypothetical protein
MHGAQTPSTAHASPAHALKIVRLTAMTATMATVFARQRAPSVTRPQTLSVSQLTSLQQTTSAHPVHMKWLKQTARINVLHQAV